MAPIQGIDSEQPLSSAQPSALATRQLAQHCLISVVVPTYQRPDLLNRCLSALFSQTMEPSLYEVVVVDDGPTGDTRQTVVAWALKSGPSVRYLPNAGRHGPAAARNKGWQAARGELIAFTDDDCIPSPDWLTAGVAAFADATVQGVSGRIVVPIPSVPTDYEHTVAGLERGPFATANCFYRRTALSAVGGFDERFTVAWREDSDLEFALRARGYRLIRRPSAIVVHPVRPAKWGISLRLQKNNVFNALLYKKHPALYRRFIQKTPPWRYYSMVGALVVSTVAWWLGAAELAMASLALWLALTAEFCVRRLAQTSRRPSHVAEMIMTSMLIPPLAIFWRVRGAFKYRVAFL